jgi:hypothetical protein
MGVTKGILDLIRAVARIRDQGFPIALALAGGGRGRGAVMKEIDAAGLADATVSLPMIAPWRIPPFIRACQAVAFLERDFRVVQHRPVIPVEVLSCGRPLLLSADVAPHVFPNRAIGNPLFNSIEVVDPRDADALDEAIRAVVARSAPAAADLAISLRGEKQVADWYASVFRRVTVGRGAGASPPDELEPALREVEEVLERRCPTLVREMDPAATLHHRALLAGTPNALVAAYAIADAVLPEITVAISGPGGALHDLAQLALAEYLALWASVDIESSVGRAAFPVPVRRVTGPPSSEDQLDALFPVASNWLRMGRFSVDAYAHLDALAQGHAASARGVLQLSASQTLLFHKAPNLVHSISRIGSAVRALLEAADGTRSLLDHSAMLDIRAERLPLFLGTVWRLHQAGVLLFRRSVPGN